MKHRLASTVLTVSLTGLTGLPAIGWSHSLEEAATELLSVRVIYLQEVSNDAMVLIRSRAEVRHVAVIPNRNGIIVADTADVVDQCEALLREHFAVVRVADPHAPQELGRYAPETLVPRVFRIADDDSLRYVVVVLRSIYSIRVLSEYPPDNTISVEAPAPVLDSIEALLRELKMLAPAGRSDGKR